MHRLTGAAVLLLGLGLPATAGAQDFSQLFSNTPPAPLTTPMTVNTANLATPPPAPSKSFNPLDLLKSLMPGSSSSVSTASASSAFSLTNVFKPLLPGSSDPKSLIPPNPWQPLPPAASLSAYKGVIPANKFQPLPPAASLSAYPGAVSLPFQPLPPIVPNR